MNHLLTVIRLGNVRVTKSRLAAGRFNLRDRLSPAVVVDIDNNQRGTFSGKPQRGFPPDTAGRSCDQRRLPFNRMVVLSLLLCGGLPQEFVKQSLLRRVFLGCQFGMPLHSDQPPMTGYFHRLDNAVR